MADQELGVDASGTADLVVGVDAGGTATRCIVASLDGTVLGRGEAAGANQRSSGPNAAGRLTEALRAAIVDIDPQRIRAGVFGIAGAGAAGHAAARGMAESAWRSAGLPGRPAVTTDIAVAFAAGTPAPEGSVLIAGTGAVAAAVRDGAIVRRCDGYGWLLGDEGSAVWLGREAVRAALAALDGRGEPTSLVAGVTRTLLSGVAVPGGGSAGNAGTQAQRMNAESTWQAAKAEPAGRGVNEGPVAPGAAGGAEAATSGAQNGATAQGSAAAVEQSTPDEIAQALIAVVYDRSPAQLGLLAPTVTRAARDGDPVARRIAQDAAGRLVAAADTVRTELPHDSPAVLAGSILREGYVAESVRAALAERDIETVTAGEGVLGAAALALGALGGEAAVTAETFDRLAVSLMRTGTP